MSDWSTNVCPSDLPVAGRALAVVTTGDDDQRHPCGAVAGGGLVDRHHLAARLMPGPSPAPVGNHLVLDADVREGAAYHDVMIDTAGREGVEVLRRHALVDPVLPCRRGRRDGPHGRDVDRKGDG